MHGYLIYKEESYLTQRDEVLSSFKNKLQEVDKLIRTADQRELLKAVKEASLSYRDISDIAIRDVQEGSLETAAKIAADASAPHPRRARRDPRRRWHHRRLRRELHRFGRQPRQRLHAPAPWSSPTRPARRC